MKMRNARKARTRSLIQIAGLVEKSGLLSHFKITLGQDLQKDEDIKDEVMILLGAFVSLRQDIERGDISRGLWKERGKQMISENA